MNALAKPIGIATYPWNLVDRYVNEQVRICLYVHSWKIADQTKVGDFVFVFEKDSAGYVHENQSNTIGKPQLGFRVRSP